ncbi:hypothetical protein HUK80_05300 [Flavobacterium sp. MAH-1]|uniref:Uncharacterized protein n=1 Tax=Flavobacterium agri TaxID=2743471 RepID=A0A7Y8Y0W2_9FLAO|nr:hypothetical protein [Flavobacterium agri]NUY80302.1 hypothetical protein [Flavobacterium agri]NYA70327.1 hypothetical protein [Flavobacterium agri]
MRSYVYFFFLVCNLVYAQNDTLIFGKVKSVREKLYFLDSIRQNAKLFSSDDEFGHMGFVSPEATIRRFNFLWKRSAASHFVNYYRQYDENGLMQIDNWFNKDNSVRNKYRYEYDEYQNRISEISTRNDTSFYRENACYDYDCRLLSTSAFSNVI